MNLFKKLILPLLLLPILFFAASNTQKAVAQIQAPHDVNVNWILIDKNGNFSKDLGEVCYTGPIQKLTIGTTTTPWTNRTADCSLPAGRQTRTFSTSTKIPVSILLGNSNYVVTGIKYTDAKTGGAIKQISGGAVNLDISSRNANVYYFIKPSVSVSCDMAPVIESVTNSGSAGSVTYTVKFKNGNPSSCAQKHDFQFGLNTPSGWSNIKFTNDNGALVTSYENVPSQDSRTLKIKVTPPSSAAAKTYDLILKLTDTQANKDASRTLKYTVTSGGGTSTDACDTDAQCKAKNINKPICKNPGTNTSTCIAGETNGGGTTACDANPPSLTVTDPTNKTRSGIAGAEKQYTLKVINKDTGSCDPKTMVLTKEKMPSDKWTGSFSANNFSLAKGTSKEVTFKVKSPDTASKGEKNISVGVKKQGGALVQQSLTYIVTPKTNTNTPTNTPSPTTGTTACVRNAPSTVITQDKNAVKPNGTIIYSVTLTNNDTAPCADKKIKLSASLPNDSWKSTFSKNDLSMKAGTKNTFTLTIDSPNFSTQGTKDVKLVVKNSEGTALLTQPLSFIISETPISVTPPITPPITDGVTPPPGQAVLNFILGLDGIGTTERINIGGNKDPQQTDKGLTFQLRNPLNNAIVFDSGNIPFSYDSGKEKFVTNFTLPSTVANGTYNVYVFGAPYISKRYPTSVNVTKGQATNLNSPQFYMVTGNIDDEGQSKDYIDIRDYNVLMSCSIFSKDPTVCNSNSNFVLFSDLNSDGLIDQSDYTLWLKEKSKQKGDLPE